MDAYTKEVSKADLCELFTAFCHDKAMDRVTLYVIIEEIMEEDGFVDSSLETLH
jgi:hypothetical protein